MTMFQTDDEVYQVIGTLCQRLLADSDIGPKLNALDMSMRFAFREPDAQIVLDCRGIESKVDFGTIDYDIDVEMSMKADDGHRLWLGTLNPVLGMASRKIKATGKITKTMALQSVLEPAHELYKELLVEIQRQDLLTQ
jgi:putative sterol carrier protein